MHMLFVMANNETKQTSFLLTFAQTFLQMYFREIIRTLYNFENPIKKQMRRQK